MLARHVVGCSVGLMVVVRVRRDRWIAPNRWIA